MIIERLKALWNLPTLLHNEGHQLHSALDRVWTAMREKPPSFVLVLLQGQYEGGAPFVAAMSGRLYSNRMKLRYDVQSPIASFSLLVFCDLERVRIVSMNVGAFALVPFVNKDDTTAPMAHHPHAVRTGNAILVELEAR